MSDKYIERENRLPLLKATDVAEILNICKSKAYQLLQNGQIPSIRIDGSVRVRPSDLDEYIQKCWSGWDDR